MGKISVAALLLVIVACGEKLLPEGESGEDTTGIADSADTDTADPQVDTETETAPPERSGFIVEDGGYIYADHWNGYLFTVRNGTGTTINPDDFSDLEAGDSLCATGTVGAMTNWSGNAQLGFFLNQAPEDGSPALAVQVDPGGLHVDISNPGDTEIRIQITGINADIAESDRWCAVVRRFDPHVIPWKNFNTNCWDDGGDWYEGQPLTSVALLVPGHNANDRPYHVCLNALLPVVDENETFVRHRDTSVVIGDPIDTDLIPTDWDHGFVGANGRLQVNGSALQNEHGDDIVLTGLSLFWSQWAGGYYNADAVRWLVEDWNIKLIRAALGIPDNGTGYLASSEVATVEAQKITTVVNAAIAEGIYVIIDWHAHKADERRESARAFFEQMAAVYAGYPNIIYEIWNEPYTSHSWNSVIKPYAEYVIEGIRQHDPDNLIIVGTRSWSQEVVEVIGNEIDDPNVAYSFHFYAGMHGDSLRLKATTAMAAGIPLFVTEWGVWTQGYAGEDHHNDVDMEKLTPWLDWMREHRLSSAMWSVNDKDEPSAIFKPGASRTGPWETEDLTTIGTLMRDVFNEL